jgi:hypothetical protein
MARPLNGAPPNYPIEYLVAGRMDRLGEGSTPNSRELFDNRKTGFREFWCEGELTGYRPKAECEEINARTVSWGSYPDNLALSLNQPAKETTP